MSISMGSKSKNQNNENKNKNLETGKIKNKNKHISNNRPVFKQIVGSDEKENVLSVVQWWERKGKVCDSVTVMPSRQSEVEPDLVGGGKNCN